MALVVASALLATAGSARAQSTLVSGETSLRFDATVLADLGLRLAATEPTAPATRSGGLGFAMEDPTALSLRAASPDFEGFSSLDVPHAGGFRLEHDAAAVSFSGFRLAAAPDPLHLELRDADGRRWLDIGTMHAIYEDATTLRISNADVVLSADLAALLDRPDLAGSYVGVLDATLRFAEPGDTQSRARSVPLAAATCAGDFVQPPDLALVDLYGLTQVAREAGVRVAIAPSADLTNLGPGDVMWNKAIAPDSPVGPHPFLSLAFYRLSDGVLEQIGRGDVKHAFHAQNSGCDCLAGPVLYAGCSDTYGVNNNIARHHLAPRNEINARTRTWTALGSHFDGTPVDEVRSHDDASGEHDAFDHRLVVREPDLETPGARYFVEAWYLTSNDSNLLNSIGRREVTPSLAGSTWSFPNATAAMTPGSALDEFVDPNSPGADATSELVDTGEGRVQLGVRVTDLGGGTWHYEYALMNFDFDRQVRVFTLPTLPSIAVSNLGFGDGDADTGNDWTPSVDDHLVTWSAPSGGAQDWGAMVSFRFDADRAPEASQAALTPLEGASPDVRVSTLAPVGFAIPGLPGLWRVALAALALVLGAVTAARLRAVVH